MSQSHGFTRNPADAAGLGNAAAMAWRRVAIGLSATARIAVVLLIAYVGAIIVRHVTQALCAVTGHTPPAWTVDG